MAFIASSARRPKLVKAIKRMQYSKSADSAVSSCASSQHPTAKIYFNIVVGVAHYASEPLNSYIGAYIHLHGNLSNCCRKSARSQPNALSTVIFT